LQQRCINKISKSHERKIWFFLLYFIREGYCSIVKCANFHIIHQFSFREILKFY